MNERNLEKKFDEWLNNSLNKRQLSIEQRLFIGRDDLNRIVRGCEYVTTLSCKLNGKKGRKEAKRLASILMNREDLSDYAISSHVLPRCYILPKEITIRYTANLILRDLYKKLSHKKLSDSYNCVVKQEEKDRKLYIGLILGLLAVEEACNKGKLKYHEKENKYLCVLINKND